MPTFSDLYHSNYRFKPKEITLGINSIQSVTRGIRWLGPNTPLIWEVKGVTTVDFLSHLDRNCWKVMRKDAGVRVISERYS